MKIIYLIPTLALFAASVSDGQSASQKRPMSAKEASQSFRSNSPRTRDAYRTLAQADGAMSAAALAELADTLIAIANASPSSVRQSARREAILALSISGTSDQSHPYAGAAQALYRIATYPGNPDAKRAIAGMVKLEDYSTVERLLAQIVASNSSESATAAVALDQAAVLANRPPNGLRDFWEGGQIRDGQTCRALYRIAVQRKWDPTASSSCKDSVP